MFREKKNKIVEVKRNIRRIAIVTIGVTTRKPVYRCCYIIVIVTVANVDTAAVTESMTIEIAIVTVTVVPLSLSLLPSLSLLGIRKTHGLHLYQSFH